MAQQKYLQIKQMASILNVEPYILRFWEKEFHFTIHRSSGGRRLYSQKDYKHLQLLKSCLYTQGLTLKFVKQHTKIKGMNTLNTLLSEKVLQNIQDTEDPFQYHAILKNTEANGKIADNAWIDKIAVLGMNTVVKPVVTPRVTQPEVTPRVTPEVGMKTKDTSFVHGDADTNDGSVQEKKNGINRQFSPDIPTIVTCGIGGTGEFVEDKDIFIQKNGADTNDESSDNEPSNDEPSKDEPSKDEMLKEKEVIYGKTSKAVTISSAHGQTIQTTQQTTTQPSLPQPWLSQPSTLPKQSLPYFTNPQGSFSNHLHTNQEALLTQQNQQKMHDALILMDNHLQILSQHMKTLLNHLQQIESVIALKKQPPK